MVIVTVELEFNSADDVFNKMLALTENFTILKEQSPKEVRVVGIIDKSLLMQK